MATPMQPERIPEVTLADRLRLAREEAGRAQVGDIDRGRAVMLKTEVLAKR